MPKETEFFTLKEVSEYLRIPHGTIYKLTRQKKIPCFRVGLRLRFRKDSIDRWIAKMERMKKK